MVEVNSVFLHTRQLFIITSAFVVSSNEMIGVVHRGGVYGKPIENAESLSVLREEVQLDHLLVRVPCIFGLLLLRISLVGGWTPVDVGFINCSSTEIYFARRDGEVGPLYGHYNAVN